MVLVTHGRGKPQGRAARRPILAFTNGFESRILTVSLIYLRQFECLRSGFEGLRALLTMSEALRLSGFVRKSEDWLVFLQR